AAPAGDGYWRPGPGGTATACPRGPERSQPRQGTPHLPDPGVPFGEAVRPARSRDPARVDLRSAVADPERDHDRPPAIQRHRRPLLRRRGGRPEGRALHPAPPRAIPGGVRPLPPGRDQEVAEPDPGREALPARRRSRRGPGPHDPVAGRPLARGHVALRPAPLLLEGE